MAEAPPPIKVPPLAWSGDTALDLTFPAGWEVVPCLMQGHNAPRLTEEQHRRAFADPIGCPPLRELARGKKRVAVLFDDLSRPTKAYQIVPYVLEELAAGGVGAESIQFICALGAHGALTAADFRKKLGDDIVARFRVYNHDPFGHCVPIGTTTRGTPVQLNAAFAEADLKVGIGTILPHHMIGFSGGAKIVLPGVASIETIRHNHLTLPPKAQAGGAETAWGVAQCDGNAMFLDVQDACRLAGLDVKVDALVNGRCDTAALFVGETAAEHAAGIQRARRHYLTPRVDRPQVVVANANAKAAEAGLALGRAVELLPDEGGAVVLIVSSPLGEVPHYVYGRFGDTVAGRLELPCLAPRIRKLIVLMPWPDKAFLSRLGPPDAIHVARTWPEVLLTLKPDYRDGARVAVIPDGTMQYFG
jgi:nickel-dependent lactate racemase